jgi:hypothetical protein
VKALSRAAAEQAAFTGSKELVYCYLTLRPLAATLRGKYVRSDAFNSMIK